MAEDTAEPRASEAQAPDPLRKNRTPTQRAERPTKRNMPQWRRQRFVRAYLANGGNGTRAAIAAGYSPSSAADKASELLKEPAIAVEIEQAKAKAINEGDLTVALTLREMARIAASDPRKFYDDAGRMLPPAEWDDSMASAVSSIDSEEIWQGSGRNKKLIGYSRKLKFWNKPQALDTAAKILGLFQANNAQKATGQRKSLEIVFVPSPGQGQVTEERYRVPARFKRADTVQVSEIIEQEPKDPA